jgi:phosphate transport system permease protein
MTTGTAEPTDFFSSANAARSGVRSLWSKFLSGICVGLALLTLVPLFSIVFLVLKNGLPLLTWSVFTELPPAAGMTGGDFGKAVVGTLLMVGIALVLATPFGILSAVYINEYNPY